MTNKPFLKVTYAFPMYDDGSPGKYEVQIIKKTKDLRDKTTKEQFVNSRTFNTKKEAESWKKQMKEQYK